MAIDRRSLLLGTIAFAGAAPFGRAYAAGGNESDVAFVSAARRAAGDFCVLLLRADGSVVREIALSGRGHDIAIHRPSGRVAVFARRPGTFAVAFEALRATPPQIFAAAEGRHFYGHGAFSSDGRLLYASENDIAGARGVIGIYDVARGYRKIGEHPSHGMGPHEIHSARRRQDARGREWRTRHGARCRARKSQRRLDGGFARVRRRGKREASHQARDDGRSQVAFHSSCDAGCNGSRLVRRPVGRQPERNAATCRQRRA